jgi:hypothetical protein
VESRWKKRNFKARRRFAQSSPNHRRNFISKKIAFSTDGNQFVASIEGINCRSLKFYFQDQGSFQLLSKVENCHKGSGCIHLACFGDGFVSYSESDGAIKVWIRMRRRKESIL